MSDHLVIAGRAFSSRLIVGTGKYRSFPEMARAHAASGADMKPTLRRSKRGPNRKHDHFRVTVTYSDNGQSAKVFTDRERADKFATRQAKSRVVKSAKVEKLT